MSREVRNRVSLDASRFERGVRSIRRNTLSMQRNFQSLQSAARQARRGMLMLTGTIAAIGGAVGLGTRNVINLGGELNHLRQITGETESNLAILQGAFKDSGVGSNNLQTRVNRLRQSIDDARRGTGRAADGFEKLGLNVEHIAALGARDQLEEIGAAIMQIENPTERAARAMDLFGQRGADMLQLFETGAIGQREQLFGEQAELLEKNSVLFEAASTRLGRVGEILRGFFVGIADRIVPAIMPMLDKFEALAPRLLEAGVRFGEGLRQGMAVVLGAFDNNTLGRIATESLKVAGAEFINFVARGWRGIGMGFGRALQEGMGAVLEFASQGFMNIALNFARSISESLEKEVASLGSQIAMAFGISPERAVRASTRAIQRDPLPALTDFISDASVKMSDAFFDGMADAADFEVFNTTQNKKVISDLIAGAMQTGLDEIERQELKFETPERDSVVPELGDVEAQQQQARRQFLQGVSSLAEVGGGGGVAGVDALTDQSRQQTGLLREIRNFNRQVRDGIDRISQGRAIATLA